MEYADHLSSWVKPIGRGAAVILKPYRRCGGETSASARKSDQKAAGLLLSRSKAKANRTHGCARVDASLYDERVG